MACTSFIEPLNLECLFINTFSGSIAVFIAVSIIAIAVMAAKFRMNNFTTMAMFGVFVILFFPILGAEISDIYVIIAIILGIVLGKIAANMIKR